MENDSEASEDAHDTAVEGASVNAATSIQDASCHDALDPERHAEVVPVSVQVLSLQKDVVVSRGVLRILYLLGAIGALWPQNVQVACRCEGHRDVVVEDHGSELIDVVVLVDFVYDGVVSLTSVPLVEKHFEENCRALVASCD